MEGVGGIVGDLDDRGTRYRAAFIHLTYAPGVVWAADQITACTAALREWCRRRGYWCHYVWRLEFGSKNGRPHYHLLVFLPPRVRLPLFDKRGWWPHGMTKAEWARSPAGYMAKYCAKDAIAQCAWDTKGARWTGAGGLTQGVRLAIRWRLAPRWLLDFRSRIDGDSGCALGRLGSRWRVGPWLLRSPWSCTEAAGGWLQFEWRGFGADSVAWAG